MIEGQEGVSWNEWLEIARLADRLPIEALYRSDHHLSLFQPGMRSSLDAWTTIAGLASATKRIRFGTLVSPVTFRHPAQFARIVATADHISGGRVEVGVGAGWYEAEHTSFGFAFPDDLDRIGMLEEYVEVICRLWSEESVTFAGHYFRLDSANAQPKPLQQPRPPLLLGGLGRRRASALAAAWADEYNLYGVTPADVARRRAGLVAACQDLGRDPDTLGISVNINVLVGTDPADLRLRAARSLDYQAEEGDPSVYVGALGADHLVGTPDQVVEQILAFSRAGATRLMLQMFPHDDLEAIELIGSQVIPHVNQ